jgi:hypothetical protein
MTDKERKEMEDEVRCLLDCETHCGIRATCAWSDKEASMWRRAAADNREKREVREVKLKEKPC